MPRRNKQSTFLHRLEGTIDMILYPMITILIVAFTLEFFFLYHIEWFRAFVSVFDNAVITVLIVDLIFKFNHARSIPSFLRHHWIDILAILPLALIIRMAEFVEALKGIKTGAKTTQKAIEAEALIAREIRAGRMLRFIGRSPRIIKALQFYMNPRKR